MALTDQRDVRTFRKLRSARNELLSEAMLAATVRVLQPFTVPLNVGDEYSSCARRREATRGDRRAGTPEHPAQPGPCAVPERPV